MKITILGCGGSFGSPLAWNRHGNIDLNNKRNFRTRSSVLIEYKNTNILIDTSPDLRQQLYNAKCTNIDAVFFTHIHSFLYFFNSYHQYYFHLFFIDPNY